MNITKTITVWAKEVLYAEPIYIMHEGDMSEYGYVKVGEQSVTIECKEPDFEAIKVLQQERQELMDRHSEEVKEVNQRMTELGA